MDRDASLAALIVKALKAEDRAGHPGVVVAPDLALRPRSIDDAEAVQDAVLAGLSWTAGAWKLGATTILASQALKLDRFFSGLVPPSRVLQSPARLSRRAMRQTGVECELATRFGRDLAARPGGYAPSEVRETIATLHPAIEIPQSRFGALGAEGSLALVADNGAAGWAVVGPGTPLSEGDLDGAFPVTLSMSGVTAQRGDAASLLRPPLDLVTDHVNRLCERGRSTHAGEYVLTGSLTPFHLVEGAALVVADFGPLGSVEIELVD